MNKAFVESMIKALPFVLLKAAWAVFVLGLTLGNPLFP